MFFAPSVAPAVAFYRGRVPARWLRTRGVTVAVMDLAVVSNLSMTPAPWHFHPFSNREEPLLEHRRQRRWPTFIGLDDNLWVEPEWTPRAGRVQRAMRAVAEGLLPRFDGVFVTTEPIAEAARRFNPNVVIVPNALPPLGELPMPDPITDDREALRIGWAGSPGHERDLDGVLVGPLLRLLGAYPKARAVFFGHTPERLRSHPQVETVGWAPMEQYYKRLGDLALGAYVAPLLDDRFNEARSNLKAVDAGALGIPFVGSNVGPYKRTVKHGVTGLLVENTEDAWYEALRTLIEEPALRRELGENGRRWVAEHGTIETTGPLWAKALGVSL